MNRKIKLLSAPDLAEVSYAYASVVPEGFKLIHLAGACPLDNDGNVPDGASIEEQTKLCMNNIRSVLNQIGASIADVVYSRILVVTTKREDLVEAWQAYKGETDGHDVPSTLHGVTVLGYFGQKVEIEITVALESNFE